MRIKYFILLLAVLEMAGCSFNKNAAGGISGEIDCYSIRVVEGGSTSFNATYYTGYSSVYEYKNAEGEKIYTPTHYTYYDDSDNSRHDSIISAYPDRNTNNYTIYTFSRFVGFLLKENNYYLDLDTRIIDSEIKLSEYKYTDNPSQLPEGTEYNNKEAYNCAKNNYYMDVSYSVDRNIQLRLDLTESSLERHTYTILGQDSIITYKEKWF